MKFSISCNELQKVLSNISGVIPQKSTLPILENFLFELEKDKLKITATDIEMLMSISVKAKGLSDGKIAIPGKRLLETVRSLQNTDIEISVDKSNNKITMITETGEYKLTGESHENFPTIGVPEKTDDIKIDAELLKRIISKTTFAVSPDELRPAMTGVLVQIRKNEIRAVSTDGHRLVKMENKNLDMNKVDKDIIIPVKALNLVLRTLTGKECSVSLSESHVMFRMDDTVLMSRMIEEKYPNYESVIPLDNEKKLIADKNQLLNTVKRTALFASSTTHQVRFSMKNGKAVISAEDIDYGSEAKETVKCEYSSEPMEIGFNSSYVTDILSHIDTDEVIFLFSSSTRACIIQPGTQRDGENLLMLVMPVRLNV